MNPEKKFPFPRPSRPCAVCQEGSEVEIEQETTRTYGIVARAEGSVRFRERVWDCAVCKKASEEGLGYLDDDHPWTDDVQDRFNELQYRKACQERLNAMRGSDLKSMREWAGLSHVRMGQILGVNSARLEEAELRDWPLFEGFLGDSAKHLIAMEASSPGTLRQALAVLCFEPTTDTFCVDLYEPEKETKP